MNTELKQKLTLLLVLLATTAFFLPILFHKSKTYSNRDKSIKAASQNQDVQMPVHDLHSDILSSEHETEQVIHNKKLKLVSLPDDSKLEQPVAPHHPAKPSPVVSTAPSHQPLPQLKSEPKSAAKQASPHPVSAHKGPHVVKDKNGKVVAWVLQLGTFSHADLATALVDKARMDGYPVYTREVHSGKQSLIQVFLGPFIDKDKIVAVQKELRIKYQLQPLLRVYQLPA